MRGVGVVDIAVAVVAHDVALIVRHASSPIATVVTNHLAGGRVAVGIECQRLVGSNRCPWQGHVNRGRICLWCNQSSLQTFSILLRENGLLIQLVVERIGKEVTAGHKVCGALDRAVADDGDLRCTRGCRRQRHKAGAVAVDRDRVVGGQGQQRIVPVHRNVACSQDLKRKVIRAGAACGIDHPPCHIVNWHAHDLFLPCQNCTKLFAANVINLAVSAHLRPKIWKLNLEISRANIDRAAVLISNHAQLCHFAVFRK